MIRPDPLPTRLHALSPARVRLLAFALFLATSATLFLNQDAGFTRDESFYFGYAESYQEWFVDIEDARDPDERAAAFGREPTVRIWSGNFEHPPLAKQLFGFAWRAFAQKDRRAIAFRVDPPEPRRAGPSSPGATAASPELRPSTSAERLRFDVLAGRATGFPEGSEVLLLAPLAQGGRIDDPTRELAQGRVIKRHRDRAEVEVAASATGLAPERLVEVADLCSRPPPSEPAAMPITPCMGREVRSLDILSESQAFRLTGILSGGLAVMLTFLLGELMFGWLVALLGSLLFLFVPEHFFHGYLACFDMPIVAMQLLTIYAFWRSLGDRRWALVAGLAWGLALLTKHNAFFVPFSLIVFWIWAGKHAFSLTWVGLRAGLFRITLPKLPLAFLVMPVIGLTALFVFWPRLWYDPLQSLRDWFGFHIHHEHYMQYWFGEPLQVPPFPFSYPFEKTLLTYPEVFLVLIPIGALYLVPPGHLRLALSNLFARLRRRLSRTSGTADAPPRPATPMSPSGQVALFLLVNGLVPILVIALPSTPIFGGIKHWMTGAPFLALVASYGLFRLAQSARLHTLAAAALAVLVIAHPIKSSVENAWLGTNHYNTLFAGGLQGGADKRLMRIFWGHEARWVCEWLNAHAPPNARVYWQDATWGTYEMYQREGWLRHDIRYLGDYAGADIALNETLQALWEPDQRARRALDVAGPLFVLARHGVPYLNVYVRPELGLAPP